jgi:hypothetical protein
MWMSSVFVQAGPVTWLFVAQRGRTEVPDLSLRSQGPWHHAL